MKYKNIYKINNKYHIIKNIYNQKINYGTYSNKKDAIKQRKILRNNEWIKSEKTGYPPSDEFIKYNIIQRDDKYYISNNKNKKEYGSYENYEYTKIINKILPFYENHVNIKEIEKQARREFYKYIHYNKLNNRYQVTYKGHILGTYKNIIDALNERDIIVKYDADEELMCEYPIINIYDEKTIPLYPNKIENITRKNNKTNKYELNKQIKNNKIRIGSYSSYNLAVLVKNYLDQNKWNKKSVEHIIKVTENIQKRNKRIHKRNNKYYVEFSKNNKTKIYAYYDNIELARYIRNSLEENNWNLNNIKDYEKKFYKDKIKTKYYYDNMDFLKIK